MAKSRPSCFGETMLEKKRVVSYVSELHGHPQKFFHGGQYWQFAYRFADKWTFIESFTLSIPQKIPHESTCSTHILLNHIQI